jgi:glycosyltransferase involved in cell wall biosynthesis
VDDTHLRDLYRGCRAVIMPGVEDFGIVPLEAMACGRPAVVYAEGGGAETVVDQVTGLVFKELRGEVLRASIDSLEALSFNRDTLRARAETYAQSAFESRFQAFVRDHLPSFAPW